MKNLTIFILFACVNVFAQTVKTSELTAEGTSSIKVKPDIAILTITVSKQNESEKSAIKELNEEIEKLQKFFAKLGFSNSSIKIADYNIQGNRYGDEEKQYSATNKLVLEFKLDTKVLDAFYQELQAGNYKDTEVEFDTQISQQLEKTTRRSLVQLAIEDAKANADNISKALGVKIASVKSVSKFGNETQVVKIVEEVKYKALAFSAPAAPATSFSKFEVTEKELDESITIVFEIAKL